jgi:hypothetical protein
MKVLGKVFGCCKKKQLLQLAAACCYSNLRGKKASAAAAMSFSFAGLVMANVFFCPAFDR